MLNALDLFSGIGGLTVALSPWARPVAYCENDRYAQAVLLSQMREGNIPPAPIWTDVRTLRGDVFDVPIDIIYGGFPCQDISLAGLGAGLAGERSGLVFQIFRLIDELSPSFVFLENVPAIRGRGAERVGKELAHRGYDSRWTVISASQVGAPHLRKRWFMLAYRDGDRRQELAQRYGETDSRGPVQFGADPDGFRDAIPYAVRESIRDVEQRRPGRRSGRVPAKGEAESMDDGGEESLADSPGSRRNERIRRESRALRDEAWWEKSQRLGPGVADTDVARLQGDGDGDGGELSSTQSRGEGAASERGGPLGDSASGRWQQGDADRRGSRPGAISGTEERFGPSDSGSAMERGESLWPVKSGLGRTPDGLPTRMDGSGGLGDGEAEEAGAAKVMRYLQKEFVSEALWRATRGLECLQAEEVLFSFVREYESGGRVPRELLSGSVTSEGLLRAMREKREPSRASLRRGSAEQYFRKYPDALWALSQSMASRGASPWGSPFWESGTTRVAMNIPDRVDRLRGIGNAVVPLQAQEAFRRLLLG